MTKVTQTVKCMCIDYQCVFDMIKEKTVYGTSTQLVLSV